MNVVKRCNPMSRLLCSVAAALVGMLLIASGARAAIVEVLGAGEFVSQSTMDAFVSQCANCGGIFYVNKVTLDHQNDGRVSVSLQAINEQQQVTLSSSIQTNNPPYEQASVPSGSPIGWEKPGATIPAGQVVNSHYVWLNAPCDHQQGCYVRHDVATFKFDGPIIGLIGGPVELNASNGPIGLSTVGYTPTVTGFVDERYPNNPTTPTADGIPFPLSGDIVYKLAPAVLTVDFTSVSGDYVRVVTAANVPLQPGDFDHDYDVDNDDYAIWRSTMGSTSELDADSNGNGVVDAADYVLWRRNFGYSYTFPGAGSGSSAEFGMGTAVPEVSSVHLFVLGLFLRILLRQTRRCGEPGLA